MYSRALGGLGQRVQWSTGWTRPACTVEHWVDWAGVYSRALGGLGWRVQWSTGWTRPACTVEH